MITQIPLLQSVRVASPCNADWNEMQAVEGERVHFCTGCGKNVYNLSAMSQLEAEGLLRKHEGRLCVRYYQRRDGTVLTGDCPVGAQAVRMALMRRSVVAAGLFALMIGAMAGINRAEMSQTRVTGGAVAIAPQAIEGEVVIPVQEPKPEPVVGKMAIPEPQATMGIVSRPTLHVTMGGMSRPTLHDGDIIATVPDQPYEYHLDISPKSVEAQSAYSAREAPEKDSTDEAILKSRNEK